MTQATIAIGDAVRASWDHKGPVMTVYDFCPATGYSVAKCNWIDSARVMHFSEFPIRFLNKTNRTKVTYRSRKK